LPTKPNGHIITDHVPCDILQNILTFLQTQ
jgi:hypothetical protein